MTLSRMKKAMTALMIAGTLTTAVAPKPANAGMILTILAAAGMSDSAEGEPENVNSIGEYVTGAVGLSLIAIGAITGNVILISLDENADQTPLELELAARFPVLADQPEALSLLAAETRNQIANSQKSNSGAKRVEVKMSEQQVMSILDRTSLTSEEAAKIVNELR